MEERSRTGITRLKPVGRLLEVKTAAEGLLEKGKGPGIRDKDDVAGTRAISSTACSLVKFVLNGGMLVANPSKEELVLIHESEGRLKDVDATNAGEEWENRVIRRVVSANLGWRKLGF